MATSDALYSELMPDTQAVAAPLFEFSEMCLRKRGNFLPHGAVLTEQREVKVVAAVPDTGSAHTNARQVLPILHEALRAEAREVTLRAIGIAENVTITLEGKGATQAIKVLVEHARGLTVALYLPYKRKLVGGYEFATPIAVPAEPEVKAWAQDAA